MNIKNLVLVEQPNGTITIQKHPYISHGGFIEIDNQSITLFEIPNSGGNPIEISKHESLNSAIKAYNELT